MPLRPSSLLLSGKSTRLEAGCAPAAAGLGGSAHGHAIMRRWDTTDTGDRDSAVEVVEELVVMVVVVMVVVVVLLVVVAAVAAAVVVIPCGSKPTRECLSGSGGCEMRESEGEGGKEAPKA